jgi:hypothetical protein
MRVCAADVAPDRTDSGLRIAGTSCARVVGAPEGGSIFDPAIGRMNNLQSETVNLASGINRIGGWTEVQRPNWLPMVFVLIQPRDLPASIDSAAPSVPTGPTILAGVKLVDGHGDPPPGLRDILGQSTEVPDARVMHICRDLKDVVCYSLGERSVITAAFDVTLNGRSQEVGVGATVGDVLDMLAPDLTALDLMGAVDMARSADPTAKARLADAVALFRMYRVFAGRLERTFLPATPGTLPRRGSPS